MSDPYVWHDPAQLIEDASWVKVTREALTIERKAWAAADAERKQLSARVRELEAVATGLQPSVDRSN